MATTVLIVNPAAGAGGCGKGWPRLAERLAARGITYAARLTEAPGHATYLTREALRAGATTIVAVGGDGTINEVANGFFPDVSADAERINPHARLGLIPMGTGSSLARALGLLRPSIDILSAFGPNAQEGRVDAARISFPRPDGTRQERYFTTHMDIGIGSETLARLERSPLWIKALGKLSYTILAFQTILRHRALPSRYVVDDGPPVFTHLNMAFVANGAYTGGTMWIAPHAAVDDGQLDFLVLNAVSKLAMIRLLAATYRGTHLGHPSVRRYLARRLELEITAATPRSTIPIEVDGDCIGEVLPGQPIEIAVHAQWIPLVLPAKR